MWCRLLRTNEAKKKNVTELESDRLKCLQSAQETGGDPPLHLQRVLNLKSGQCVCSTIVSSSPSSVGYLSQQHALQLPDPAFLWQRQALLRSLLLLQQLLDVAGGAQQDVARGLHGEDGPSQSLPGSTAQTETEGS